MDIRGRKEHKHRCVKHAWSWQARLDSVRNKATGRVGQNEFDAVAVAPTCEVRDSILAHPHSFQKQHTKHSFIGYLFMQAYMCWVKVRLLLCFGGLAHCQSSQEGKLC